ncbi:HAD family hydrolase [Paenibacillus xylanexedens]|uniref:HAD family hydrolase n=1 Tax=Paenibacillus xylanexedens TaxID=528191 RepID=UPI001C92FF0A|nr:HAD family hydrolase [Paenibacillus xylanexedens]
MNVQYEKVREFHDKFGVPHTDKPAVMSAQRRTERYLYMSEELNEFDDAETVVDQADAMIDLIYLALGTLVEIGVKPAVLFDIVHEANMSKVWPDGTVHYDPITNKVVKPPTFIRPEPLLQAEIERQMSGVTSE